MHVQEKQHDLELTCNEYSHWRLFRGQMILLRKTASSLEKCEESRIMQRLHSDNSRSIRQFD
jgi:hypothetical protein